MNTNLSEVLNKYNLRKEEFFSNVIKSMEVKSDLYSGLTLRETKSLYKEISDFYSKENKTTNINNFLKSFKLYDLMKSEKEREYKTEEIEVNQILEGGFKGGYIYKIIGATETGKTTLINSLVRANINNKDIKILFFTFIDDNIDSDILNFINSIPNSNLTIVDNIRSFSGLLLSEYLKNYGEKLKNYNIIIFDPFTIILYKGHNVDSSLLNNFNEIINSLAWKYNICFIFSVFARKLGNTFWYSKNDQGNIERLILRNYDNLDILQNTPNCVQIYLYKMKKINIIKYYMKVTSSCMAQASNFIEWDLKS